MSETWNLTNPAPEQVFRTIEPTPDDEIEFEYVHIVRNAHK